MMEGSGVYGIDKEIEKFQNSYLNKFEEYTRKRIKREYYTRKLGKIVVIHKKKKRLRDWVRCIQKRGSKDGI